MDKQIITFSANEQNLVRIGGEYHYSSNKVSYIGAHFDLGANWDGFDSVRAVWFTDRINGISTVLDGEGNCTVPTEVLKKKDRVFVNLVGSIVSNGELTDRLTTYPAVALVVDSKAKVDSTETAPVTPSQFEQFVSIVQDAVANIKDIVSTTLNADYTLTFVYSDGTSYTTPSIRGERGPQGADGADGRDGTDGRDGADGVTPSLSVGTVTTLPSTEDAYVTRTGTDENPVFNFGIPQGPKGDKGDPGEVTMSQLSALLPTDTASGSIASFPDGTDLFPALSVKAQIEPIQDLHGYDKPWSGGAGTNMIDADNPLTFTTTKAIVFATPIPSGTMVYAYSSSHTYETEPSSGTKVIAMRFEDANNQVVGITYANSTGIDRATLTGDAVRVLLYANGYNYTDSLDVTVTVKDLMLSKSAITSYEPYSNICPISGHTEVDTHRTGKNLLDNNGLSDYATWESLGSYNYAKPLNLPKDTQVTISGQHTVPSGLNAYVYLQRFDGTNWQDIRTLWQANVSSMPYTFTTSDSPYRLWAYNPTASIATIDWMQIELGTTTTAYEPYNGTTYTTSLGQTVYGGVLDVISGELVITHGYVDLGTLSWSYSGTSGQEFFYHMDFDAKAKSSGEALMSAICDSYSQAGYNAVSGNSGTFGISQGGTYLKICDTNYSSSADFKTAMSGHYLCYELATPTTIQLTPQEVKLLLGNNTIWSDGDVAIVYSADVTKWIEKKLS